MSIEPRAKTRARGVSLLQRDKAGIPVLDYDELCRQVQEQQTVAACPECGETKPLLMYLDFRKADRPRLEDPIPQAPMCFECYLRIRDEFSPLMPWWDEDGNKHPYTDPNPYVEKVIRATNCLFPDDDAPPIRSQMDRQQRVDRELTRSVTIKRLLAQQDEIFTRAQGRELTDEELQQIGELGAAIEAAAERGEDLA